MDMENSCSEISLLENFSSLKDEQRMKFSRGDDEEEHPLDDQGTSMEISNPVHDDNDNDDGDEVLLKSTKAQMGEVKEENERLKVLLEGIMKDYKSLQTHFDIIQHEKSKKLRTNVHDHEKELESDHDHHQLVSLSLGIRSTAPDCNNDHHRIIVKKDAKNMIMIKKSDQDEKLVNDHNQGLDLSLELMKFSTENCGNHDQSSANSSKEVKEVVEETTHEQIWPPNKLQKTMRSATRTVEAEVSDLPNSITTHLKKTRVSVRARCETPTMYDGCQWRKYGQKIAKGNPCPRAYYRCTVSPSCPVRKLVQRCQEDVSILITTYEGTHNHPLPLSATTIASTTSAAASMLQSRSSSSQTNLTVSATAPLSTSTATNLPAGLNFNASPNPIPQQQFYFPNSTISTSNSHPTITLDLTSPPQPPPLSASSHFRTSFPNISFSSYNRSLNPSGYSLNDIAKQKNFLEHYYQSHRNINDQSSTTSSSLASAKLQTALAAAVLNSFVGNTNNGGGHEINYSTTSPYLN